MWKLHILNSVCVSDPNWFELDETEGNCLEQDANTFTLYCDVRISLSQITFLNLWDFWLQLCLNGVYGDKVARSKTPYFQKEMFFQRVCNHLIFIPLSRDILSKREISQKLERPLWDVCIWMQITQILNHGGGGMVWRENVILSPIFFCEENQGIV